VGAGWIAVVTNKLTFNLVDAILLDLVDDFGLNTSNFFVNNSILFLSSYVVAVAVWFLSVRLPSVRIRRALRVSIIFLVVPVIYIGHPLIFFQCWMFLLVSIVGQDSQWLLFVLSIWAILILIFQLRIPSK